jgi:hypothetical protein
MMHLTSRFCKPRIAIARYSSFHYYKTMSLIAGNADGAADSGILAGAFALLSYFPTLFFIAGIFGNAAARGGAADCEMKKISLPAADGVAMRER